MRGQDPATGAERKARVQRRVADMVTDEMLTKRTGDLTDAEVAVLRAALDGPHGKEIVARIDAIRSGQEP